MYSTAFWCPIVVYCFFWLYYVTTVTPFNNNNNNLLRYFHIYTWHYLSNIYE